MDFTNTKYAKNFFEVQLPELIQALNRIADNQETALQEKGKPLANIDVVAPDSSSKVYVCYEENSVVLYSEAGNINRLFVTSDEALAREWARRSYEVAADYGYHPMDEADYAELMDHIGNNYASVWVYLGGRENARENYGICVDAFLLEQSREQLERLFPKG